MNTELPKEECQDDDETMMPTSFASILLTVCVLGICTNCLIILVVVKKSKLTINWPITILILFLAFYDFLTCSIAAAWVLSSRTNLGTHTINIFSSLIQINYKISETPRISYVFSCLLYTRMFKIY
jgi:hypothetical protein